MLEMISLLKIQGDPVTNAFITLIHDEGSCGEPGELSVLGVRENPKIRPEIHRLLLEIKCMAQLIFMQIDFVTILYAYDAPDTHLIISGPPIFNLPHRTFSKSV